jgi:hypothetical protein
MCKIGALVAQDPEGFESMKELTEEDKKWLRMEGLTSGTPSYNNLRESIPDIRLILNAYFVIQDAT